MLGGDDERKRWRVIATDNCICLEDIRLASFDTLEEAEAFRPDNIPSLIEEGYKWLEIYPEGWADSPGGYRPFARLRLIHNNKPKEHLNVNPL